MSSENRFLSAVVELLYQARGKLVISILDNINNYRGLDQPSSVQFHTIYPHYNILKDRDGSVVDFSPLLFLHGWMDGMNHTLWMNVTVHHISQDHK